MGFKTALPKVKSWSNTRYSDYSKCPAYFMYKHLMKLPEPKHPAMARGIEIANKEDDYFKGKARTVPKEVHKNLHPDFRAAKKAPGMFAEGQWGLDKNWQPVDYFDWDNCWLRAKVDVGWTDKPVELVSLRDNKTGKFSDWGLEGYMIQLDLYAASGAAYYPTAEAFDLQLWFTDLGIKYPQTPLVVTRAEALKKQKEWSKKVIPLFNDTRFDPKPNDKCKWCHFRKSNGGPCKF